MRRTIAAVGLLGLGLLGITIPAGAAPGDGQVEICHETGSEQNPVIEIDVNDNGHDNGNGGNGNGGNGNGGNGNGIGHGCPENEEPPAEEPPAEEPPAEEPPAEQPPAEQPPAEQPPVVAPPAEVPAAPVAAPVVKPAAPVIKPAAKPAAAVPVAAVPVAAAPVAVPAATNAGYNVQTAAGGGTETGIPAWLASLTALFTGLSALVLARGGARARKLEG
ncbi:hypothetical protein [Arthrobacter sp. ISL-28]|uniref:hypothetical protein n=1 Tax=Arthrobacter sp. ISL-28 TaxID=2819108 RepID=UPI001BEA1B70|nr:hypothetical protein [Arthrobacter sp. ISL-28]MBT2521232.1 hypothetical protein [Arthrobacter sp. ISL-28]